MKHLFLLLMLLCCSLNCNAQTDSTEVKKPMYSVRHGFVSEEAVKMAKADEFQQRHLFQAGIAMQRWANLQYCSVASSLIGGTLFLFGGLSDNTSTRTGLFVGGGVMTLASFGCLLTSIHFHDKSGRELRLSAGEVIYRF